MKLEIKVRKIRNFQSSTVVKNIMIWQKGKNSV